MVQTAFATFTVLSPRRALIRYADGTRSPYLRDNVEARWAIFDAIEEKKLTHREAFVLAGEVLESDLEDGDPATQAYLRACSLAERDKLMAEGYGAPMLVLFLAPNAPAKKKGPKVVDLEPGHFGRRPGSQN